MHHSKKKKKQLQKMIMHQEYVYVNYIKNSKLSVLNKWKVFNNNKCIINRP